MESQKNTKKKWVPITEFQNTHEQRKKNKENTHIQQLKCWMWFFTAFILEYFFFVLSLLSWVLTTADDVTRAALILTFIVWVQSMSIVLSKCVSPSCGCVCVCVRVFIIKSTKSTWIVCECDCETSLIELNFGAIFLLLQLCTQNMNSLAFFVTYFLFRNKNDENICIDRAWYHCSFIPKWVAIHSKYKCKCLRLF